MSQQVQQAIEQGHGLLEIENLVLDPAVKRYLEDGFLGAYYLPFGLDPGLEGIYQLYFEMGFPPLFIQQHVDVFFPFYHLPKDKRDYLIDKIHQLNVPPEVIKEEGEIVDPYYLRYRFLIKRLAYGLVPFIAKGFSVWEIFADIKVAGELLDHEIYCDWEKMHKIPKALYFCSDWWLFVNDMYASIMTPNQFVGNPRIDIINDILHENGLDLNKEMRYPSGRTKTTMPFIHDIPVVPYQTLRLSMTYLPSVFPQETHLVSDQYGYQPKVYVQTTSRLPVVRYQLGMSRGGFCEEQDCHTEYCGVFYYYEPYSPYWLRSNSVLVVPNKIVAYHYLSQDPAKTLGILLFNGDEIQGENFLKDPSNTRRVILAMLRNEHFDWNKHRPTFYATEDVFDQPLCLLAKKKKIDVILLTRMTGASRQVSEILDVRTKQESFGSIVQE